MIIVFLGPTAAGKTTRMGILYRYLELRGSKCYKSVVEPFGGLAYLFLFFLSRLLLYSYNADKQLFSRKKYMAILEIINPNILSRFLSVILFLDFISMIIRTMFYSILEKLQFTILLEDHVPQMLVDHITYAKLYCGNSRLTRFLYKTEYMFFSKYITNQDYICIYIWIDDLIRSYREAYRSGHVKHALGFYNKLVRGILLSDASRLLCKKRIHLKH